MLDSFLELRSVKFLRHYSVSWEHLQSGFLLLATGPGARIVSRVRIPLGHLSFRVPISRISLFLPQVEKLGWSRIGIRGPFLCNPPDSLPPFPISLFSPFPNTLSFPFAPSKVYDPFPLWLSGPASSIATKPGGGAGGVSVATPRTEARPGVAGKILTQDPYCCPKATLSPASLQKLPAAAGSRGGPAAYQPPSLFQAAPNGRAPRAPILLPPPGHPPHLPRCSARGSAALRTGLRRGEDGGSSRSGERWKEGAARVLRPTAIRESPSPCARAPR